MHCSEEVEARLGAAGWTRQFTASEPRLSEMARQYEELGFQVHLEPVDAEACRRRGVCAECFGGDGPEGGAMVIFTRPAGE